MGISVIHLSDPQGYSYLSEMTEEEFVLNTTGNSKKIYWGLPSPRPPTIILLFKQFRLQQEWNTFIPEDLIKLSVDGIIFNKECSLEGFNKTFPSCRVEIGAGFHPFELSFPLFYWYTKLIKSLFGECFSFTIKFRTQESTQEHSGKKNILQRGLLRKPRHHRSSQNQVK